MHRKLLILVGLVALGIGGVSTIALQSYAQKASTQATSITPSSSTMVLGQENTATDTDNIQNDLGGIEKPDATISQDTDKETNDDQNTTSTVKQNDTLEHGENNATNTNEIEDSN